MNNAKHFIALDSFRGICAILVVVFHINITNSINDFSFFKSGYLFVEFFFILSGFVLAHSNINKVTKSFGSFVRSRAFRLFPLHIAILIFLIMVELSKMIAERHGFSFNTEAFTADKGYKEIIPNLLLIQSWTKFTYNLSFNTPAWSISIEFYTYLIFYMTLKAGKNLGAIIWSILSIAMFLITFNGSNFIVSEVSRGVSCFFLGSLCYLIYSNTKSYINRVEGDIPFTILECMLIAAIITTLTINPEYKYPMAVSLFFMSIFTFSFERGIISKILSTRGFVHLGKLSYSIYMTHASIILIITLAATIIQAKTNIQITSMHDVTKFINAGGYAQNSILVVLILFLVVAVSHVTYNQIELRFQRIGKRNINNESSLKYN